MKGHNCFCFSYFDKLASVLLLTILTVSITFNQLEKLEAARTAYLRLHLVTYP